MFKYNTHQTSCVFDHMHLYSVTVTVLVLAEFSSGAILLRREHTMLYHLLDVDRPGKLMAFLSFFSTSIILVVTMFGPVPEAESVPLYNCQHDTKHLNGPPKTPMTRMTDRHQNM
ncbi:hypothetical protein AMATHDRAFT_65176 [Amanita thiersii Skay4041]|uniref:Uncharacterized protein n=1 Tax=Amanita thiersii Skay4041 TaxID=703135 RepID=A0A2A9NJT8_9AGAR|nr:hypothetical protein AMATHDRAFT_65176 [Amanita thiersii Skay4041]